MAWAFSKTAVMEPMKHLLSPNSKFMWTQEINNVFESSKAEITNAVKHGVRSFNPVW